MSDWFYCPSCGNSNASPFPANSPVADFFCPSCSEQYELKSQKRAFGAEVLDGAFRTMCERLAASDNPNLLLLNYDLARLAVTNVVLVPKQFFVREIIQERKPRWPPRRAAPDGASVIPMASTLFSVRRRAGVAHRDHELRRCNRTKGV